MVTCMAIVRLQFPEGLHSHACNSALSTPLIGMHAGAQYMGHEGAVTGLCLLPGAAQQLVASTDSAGACHLWSAATGALAACFAEPGAAAGPGAALLPSKARTSARGAGADSCQCSAGSAYKFLDACGVYVIIV